MTIHAENLSYRYETSEVLTDVSFAINPGEKIVLLGTNGSGKSTLLKILNGLLQGYGGSLRINGQLITPKLLKDPEYVRSFRRKMAFLFQNPDSMIFNPTVYDEIAFGPRHFLTEKEVDEIVRHWAEVTETSSLLRSSPFSLSGGQKKKVCLAACLALEPEVLFLDEPTAGLDPPSVGWLVDFLKDLPITVVTSTHALSMAPELGSRSLVLSKEHRLIHDGPTELFLKQPELLLEAELVHSHRHRHDDREHKHFHFHDWE